MRTMSPETIGTAFSTPDSAPTPRSRVKKWTTLALKSGFVAGLLYFLAQKGFISLKDTQRAFTQWQIILPAMSVLVANFFLGALRWQWLLKAQGIHLGLKRTVQLSFIGNFFNIALPGAVSGDFVKAYYIGKEVAGKRGRSFGSILFDRVAGLSALVLLAAGASLFATGESSHRLLIATRPFLLIAAFCMTAFYSYLFLVREHKDPVLMALRSMEKKMAKFESITRIYLGLRHYHGHKGTVIRVIALSLLIHLIVGWACLQFASALGEGGMPLFGLYVAVPLGLLVTAIPVAPAGVGTGHAAFLYLFSLLGSGRGADVFTLLAISNLLMGAVGGLIYLRFKDRPTQSQKF